MSCRQLSTALLTLVLLSAAATLTAAEHTKDSLDDVEKKINDGKAVLIDVREQSEWDEGHLEMATLVPLSDLRKGRKPTSLPTDRIVYAHCASGKRCLDAADRLIKLGYDVRPLKDGYRELLKAGFKKAE